MKMPLSILFMCISPVVVSAQTWVYKCDAVYPDKITDNASATINRAAGGQLSATMSAIQPPVSSVQLVMSGVKNVGGVTQAIADAISTTGRFNFLSPGYRAGAYSASLDAQGNVDDCYDIPSWELPGSPAMFEVTTCTGKTTTFRTVENINSDFTWTLYLLYKIAGTVNLPAEPVSEYSGASISVTVNPYPMPVTLSGVTTGGGTHVFYGVNTMTTTCRYSPVAPIIQVPREINFDNVIVGGPVITKPLSVSLTSGTTLPPATLTFKSTDGVNGDIYMNSARVMISDEASRRIPLDTAVTLTERVMNYSLSLDASTATPGYASSNLQVVLDIN